MVNGFISWLMVADHDSGYWYGWFALLYETQPGIVDTLHWHGFIAMYIIKLMSFWTIADNQYITNVME